MYLFIIKSLLLIFWTYSFLFLIKYMNWNKFIHYFTHNYLSHNLCCLQNGLIKLQRFFFSSFYLYKDISLSTVSFMEFIHPKDSEYSFTSFGALLGSIFWKEFGALGPERLVIILSLPLAYEWWGSDQVTKPLLSFIFLICKLMW